MTFWPLLICTVLYVLTAIGFWHAAANCGFLWIVCFGQP